MANMKSEVDQSEELQSWIDNVIVPIIVQKILEERRQLSPEEPGKQQPLMPASTD